MQVLGAQLWHRVAKIGGVDRFTAYAQRALHRVHGLAEIRQRIGTGPAFGAVAQTAGGKIDAGIRRNQQGFVAERITTGERSKYLGTTALAKRKVVDRRDITRGVEVQRSDTQQPIHESVLAWLVTAIHRQRITPGAVAGAVGAYLGGVAGITQPHTQHPFVAETPVRADTDTAGIELRSAEAAAGIARAKTRDAFDPVAGVSSLAGGSVEAKARRDASQVDRARLDHREDTVRERKRLEAQTTGYGIQHVRLACCGRYGGGAENRTVGTLGPGTRADVSGPGQRRHRGRHRA